MLVTGEFDQALSYPLIELLESVECITEIQMPSGCGRWYESACITHAPDNIIESVSWVKYCWARVLCYKAADIIDKMHRVARTRLVGLSVESTVQCALAGLRSYLRPKFPLCLPFRWINGTGSGETAQMRRLAWTFAVCTCHNDSFPKAWSKWLHLIINR